MGWTTIKWIVNIGAILALWGNLLGLMFPLPRVIYSMASDGLIFKFLGIVYSRTKTPVIGTLICGSFTGKTIVI